MRRFLILCMGYCMYGACTNDASVNSLPDPANGVPAENPVRLSTETSFDIRPVYSPDGAWIYYVSGSAVPGALWDGFSIWKMASDGTGKERIVMDRQSIHQFDISLDGSILVFYDGTHEPVWDLYTVSATGGNAVALTVDGACNMSPKWSPDGTRILFASNVDGTLDIWEMAADGTQRVKITEDVSNEMFPAYAPDGASIVYCSNQSGNFDIYRLLLADNTVTQITNTTNDEFAPLFSPDGSQIACMSMGGGQCDIFIITLQSGAVERLTREGGYEQQFPAWSPDGTKIAYSAVSGVNTDIWAYDFSIE